MGALSGLYKFEFLVGGRHHLAVVEITGTGIMPDELDEVTKTWTAHFMTAKGETATSVKLIDWVKIDKMPDGVMPKPVGHDPVLIWKTEGR